MKKSFQLFIGQNNETKKLETEKITSVLSKYFDGFTIQKCVGFWRGQQEKTAIVYICDDEKLVFECIKTLKKELFQDSITCVETRPLKFL